MESSVGNELNYKRPIEVQPEGEEPQSMEPITGSIETDPILYDTRVSCFKRPVEVAVISMNKYGKYKYDKHLLRKFVPPLDWKTCHINLNERKEKIAAEKIRLHSRSSHSKDSDSCSGSSDSEDFKSCPEYIYPHKCLLRWIMTNKKESGNKPPSSAGAPLFAGVNIHFVCERLTLRHLLQLPYQSYSGCSVCVIRFQGTYYLFLDESIARSALSMEQSASMAKSPKMPENLQDFQFWGRNFECLVTARQNEQAPNVKDISSFFESFHTVSYLTLNSHKLWMMSEIDCEDPKLSSENKYIELKTANQSQKLNQYKFLDWWTQCILNGVSKVVCGFREDNGIVQELREYPVKDLPDMAKNASSNPWKPKVCFNFLNVFLDFVKPVITEDDNKCYYVFASEPKKEIKCFKVVAQKKDLLPASYVKWVADHHD